MIEKLSRILRCIVYYCQKERAPLMKEIANMEHLLNLYEIKNSRQEVITFEKPALYNGLQISSLIFLNLLENAFKHSDVLSSENGFIEVKAAIKNDDELNFAIKNSFKRIEVKG